MTEPRIFIAIKPSDVVAEKLHAALPLHPALRQVSMGNYHITLLFIGKVDQLDQVTATFKELTLPSCFVSVTGIGAFYRHGKLKVIYMRVDPDNPPLLEMQRKISTTFQELTNDQFPVFTPHITLNRNIKSHERQDLEGMIDYTFEQPIEFEVNSIHLMNSGDFSSTRLYKTVAIRDLD
jgi:2'-5' RNA ligase